MNKENRVLLIIGVVTILVLIFPIFASAQPIDPGCDPADPACPIDGGLSLLIAAGIGIGAKKAFKNRK